MIFRIWADFSSSPLRTITGPSPDTMPVAFEAPSKQAFEIILVNKETDLIASSLPGIM